MEGKILRCHLWDVAHSRKRYKFDMYGFTSVNTRYALNTNESFVLACQSEQVFYVDDMVDKDWLVIFKTSPCDLFNVPEKDDNNTNIEDETLTNGEAYQQENHEFNIDHIDDQENNFLMSLHRYDVLIQSINCNQENEQVEISVHYKKYDFLNDNHNIYIYI